MMRLKKNTSTKPSGSSSKKAKELKQDVKVSKKRESTQLDMNPPKKRKPADPDESVSKRRKSAELDEKSMRQEYVSEPEKAVPADESSEDEDEADSVSTFKDLGIVDPLCEACEQLGYKSPTPIQAQAIPVALKGRDIIGIAVTGSGKTAAFILPILQGLLEKPQPFYAVVLSPTRELAEQTKKMFDALGSLISLKCALITGGHDVVQHVRDVMMKPHVIVATPGRLIDLLENRKGFSLRTLKCLVLDEADRLLDMDFGPSIDKLLGFIPRERNTYLFSATMSSKVDKLRRASLRDPVKVAVSQSSYEPVKNLMQHFIFVPDEDKHAYLVRLMSSFQGRSTIIFANTKRTVLMITNILKLLGFNVVGTHGKLPQNVREAALNRFREGAKDILVTTDVTARGIDIVGVGLVVNYDVPLDTTTYMHRIGRTARAGRSGRAISFVSQYHIPLWKRLEGVLGWQVPEYELWSDVKTEVRENWRPTVEEAQYHARRELRDDDKEKDKKKKGRVRSQRYDDMDLEEK